MVRAYAVPNLERWPARGLATLITFYQRYLSPYKGFRCAHCVLHGGASCSAHAKTLLLRRGIVRACQGMRARFAACASAAAELEGRAEKRRRQYDASSAAADAGGQCCCLPIDLGWLPDAASCADAGACLSF